MRIDSFEGAGETGCHLVEFAGMIDGEVLEQPLAFGCHLQDGSAAVGWVGSADQQVLAFGAVDQLDDAVVAQTQARGRVGDGYDLGLRGAGDLKKELMLLGLQASFGGGALAEVEELAEFVAEVGQGPQESSRFVGGSRLVHIYIVIRYKYQDKVGWKVTEYWGLGVVTHRPGRLDSVRSN